MAAEVFSDAWAKAWCTKLNGSEAYQKAAASWEGALILVVEADPSLGIQENRAVYLDLWHGACRDARAATPEDFEDAAYVITADPYSWKQVLEGQLEPISAIMRGKLKLTKGSVASLAPFVLAARELVAAATQVEASFPEGWT